jgi:hypothetical protein
MGREVRDASHRITLYLNVGRVHLPNEGIQTTKLDNQDLVIRCKSLAVDSDLMRAAYY